MIAARGRLLGVRLASLEIAEWASVDMAEPDGTISHAAASHPRLPRP